ncbi:hypothetical protein LTR62_003573 [Meristemomyces frigidus]|uniref:Xylanolytic transcriptional activator regulatory domain-containing protein n=1 Tax=Meristemomyces frigidus TaxID=1508187 RepID=A0AAN7YGT5_9PEZI|nr:hypothetical protein LTR62_003573 [Meristemomyces frigidus]
MLPQCGGCNAAKELCSFQAQTEDSGVFPVAYVRGLEARIRELEEGTIEARRGLRQQEFDASSTDHRVSSLSSVPSINPSTQTTVASPGGSNTLESELKDLSLEATADRYLGQSSGLSFARLTQAVLRRLQPDHRVFVLGNESACRPPSSSAGAPEALPSAPRHYARQPLNLGAIISQDRAEHLAQCYWDHSHSLYPFLRRTPFMANLRRMYYHAGDYDLTSKTWLYTMFMVLAIASTAASSLTLGDESESVMYFGHAMNYFDSALGSGVTEALSAILLQVSYSFFNKVGPNTWYLVGVGVRLAVGAGLHTNSAQGMQAMPFDVREYRRRLFFSLYMMDRVVSVSLGRPFGIQDDDIEVDVFESADEEEITPTGIVRQSHLQFSAPAAAVPLHIVGLRRICGRIFKQVYSTSQGGLNAEDRDTIQRKLHRELVDWRRGQPFPLPRSTSIPVPHFATAWYDLNYYQHVLMLYRPSPLFPVLNVTKIGIIVDSSSMFIRQVTIMQLEARYAFNWLNLFAVFTAILTLIYATTAQPEPMPAYLRTSTAIGDLKTASGILAIFGRKFTSALKCKHLVDEVVMMLEKPLSNGVTSSYSPENIAINSSIIGRHDAMESGSNTAYPVHSTGNPSYDELQRRVVSAVDVPMHNTMSSQDETNVTPFELPPDLGLFGSDIDDIGNAAAHFMASGFGASEALDM